MSEPTARHDFERAVAGLVEVIRLLYPVVGLSNSAIATVATGEEVGDELRRGLDRASESLELAETLLERVAEFLPPDVVAEFRRGGGL